MKGGNKAIIIFGPPGAGKGLQARLIAQRSGLVNFDTGRTIERIIYNPALRESKVIKRERRNFETGRLCTPSWVLKVFQGAVSKISKADLGIVFSGSPRTLFEAFGDRQKEGLIPLLKRLYGKENIFILELKVPPAISILRNSHRVVCSVCDTQLLKFASRLKRCPFCGGKLKRRSLDRPEVIKVRIKEYEERTEPIFKALRKNGFKIHFIDGKPMPAKVWQKIKRVIVK